jgi:hypothetical protein
MKRIFENIHRCHGNHKPDLCTSVEHILHICQRHGDHEKHTSEPLPHIDGEPPRHSDLFIIYMEVCYGIVSNPLVSKQRYNCMNIKCSECQRSEIYSCIM